MLSVKLHLKENNSSPEVIKLFSCTHQLSMKFSLLIKIEMPSILLINIKMPTIVDIFILYEEKMSGSAVFSKKEFAIISNFRFISKTNFMLS